MRRALSERAAMFTDSFEIKDDRFARLALPNVHLEKIWSGCRWAEGPAWFPAGRYLVWSDIPNDRMLRWDETDGSVSIFRAPANNSNGHTVDREGRLVSCEHRTRRITRTEHDGTLTVLASLFGGKRFNSPNDLVVKSDGSIWFTDPSYGIDSHYEGDAGPSEIGKCHVYRLDPTTKAVEAVATDFVMPNGIAFSPDEKFLYIADSGVTHVKNGPRHIRRFQVSDNGRGILASEIFATCKDGMFDGFRFDVAGNLWTSAGDGVHCYAPDGALIGKIRVPETVANVCFVGLKRNRLFICATTSIYAIFVNTTGMASSTTGS
jgi:gluconolactonase